MNESASTQLWHEVSNTCWKKLMKDAEGSRATAIALLCSLAVVALVNLSCTMWCAVVMLTTGKLRKPTWLFKGSMAIKDAILILTTVGYAVWNIHAAPDNAGSANHEQNFNSPMAFIFNVMYTMCVAASFVHMLLISFDRQQAISRPFRYHTGELLPYKVGVILVLSSWIFCFVVGLSVASESLNSAKRTGYLETAGSLFSIYRTPGLQKWLFAAGMGLNFAVTTGLLSVSLYIEFKRKRKRMAEIVSGVGVPEPLRSRNNSLSHSHNKNKPMFGGSHRDSADNSESDANEFLLSGGFGFHPRDLAGFHTNIKPWSTVTDDEATFFTPVNYRPSLHRRIRDTWSLYSAAMCFCAFIVTVAVPFVVIWLSEGSALLDKSTYPSFGYCIASTVMEFLLISQSVCYVTIYIITDDVFRPFFTRPFRKLRNKVTVPFSMLSKRSPGFCNLEIQVSADVILL